MIRLSICIPTYNFGNFIEHTLDSIIPELTDSVEMVILDGGSTDNTSAIVTKRVHNISNIHYYDQGFRGGIDRDIAKVLSLAQGDYCWLFSADDIMKPGAINKVLDSIQSNCDIYLCEQTLCSFNMEPIKEHPIFNNILNPTIFDLGKSEDRKKYFREARTSEAFFSFLSGPIFRRDLWGRAEEVPDSFYETCWALAGRLLSLVHGGLIVQYLGESLLYKRGENDSFLEKGVVNRLRISVDGFSHIAETIFGKDTEETYHIRRVIRNERTLFHLMFIRLQVATSCKKEEMNELNKIVLRHYSNAGIINRAKYVSFRLMPIFVIKIGDILKKILINKRIILPAICLFPFCDLLFRPW